MPASPAEAADAFRMPPWHAALALAPLWVWRGGKGLPCQSDDGNGNADHPQATHAHLPKGAPKAGSPSAADCAGSCAAGILGLFAFV